MISEKEQVPFERKVLLELLKCSEEQLKDIQKFIEKYKKKYQTDIFPYFIQLLGEELCEFFSYDYIMQDIWYYLLCHIVDRFVNLDDFEYYHSDLTDLNDNFINPEFRLRKSDLTELNLVFKEEGLDDALLEKIIDELNYFLKR